ncbi:MAG TPA: hypothetical protein VK727_15690 [Steroidobacteraceae bacterium]|nr:hypothetical protein [Steroidobacteraceae bacterium]
MSGKPDLNLAVIGNCHIAALIDDPVSGELWGNFPQTYSRVGIIVSALRLSRQWEEVV